MTIPAIAANLNAAADAGDTMVPGRARHSAAALIAAPTAQAWDRLFSVLPSRHRRDINGRRMHRLAQLMSSPSLADMYVRLMSKWAPEDALVLGLPPLAKGRPAWPDGFNAVDTMRLWDIGNYLPDDLLVKVDRAAMSAKRYGSTNVKSLVTD